MKIDRNRATFLKFLSVSDRNVIANAIVSMHFHDSYCIIVLIDTIWADILYKELEDNLYKVFCYDIFVRIMLNNAQDEER